MIMLLNLYVKLTNFHTSELKAKGFLSVTSAHVKSTHIETDHIF